jgi:phospholipid transport system substrate-binding protein
MEDGARQEYVRLFVELLRDALANRMTAYDGIRIRYLAERRESGFAEVQTRLEGSKVDTALDFRLLRHEGQWLVYDVVIEGVSLVGSYRAQFASIIRHASCAQLMERIKEQTLLVKWFENDGS